MEQQVKSEVTHIRIPSDVMHKIKTVAKREERTHAYVINRVLRQWAKNGKADTK